MDSTLALLIILIIALIFGAFFAAVETAFTSLNKIRLKNLSEHGNKKAKRALYLADEGIDKVLTTLLILNNIVHIGAASIATVIFTRLWGLSSATLCTVVMTVIVFLFAESLPKGYAAANSESLAMASCGIIGFLVKVLTPISFLFSGISKGVSKLLKTDDEPTVNEEELFDIIDNIEEEGVMEKEKSELIHSALEFDDTTVQDVLTPRIDIVGIDDDSTPDEIIEIIKNAKHSRLPVYHDTIDNITGIISIRKYIRSYLMLKDDTSLSVLSEKPFFVYKTMPIDEMLREMSSKKIHMAAVKDEYGGTLGIVTVEDVLEELVGEIWDEDDEVREDFIPTGGNRYEVSADLPVCDVFEMMEYKHYNAEDFGRKTVGAWVLEHFDCMPEADSKFRYKDIVVTILEATQSRIVKVQMQVKEEE